MRFRYGCAFPVVLLAAVSGATSTHAKTGDASDAPALDREASPRPVAWSSRWERFKGWEYAASSALMVEAFVLRFAGPEPPDAGSGWKLEEGVIDAIDVRGRGRDVVIAVSQIGYFGSMAYRLVDSTFLPGLMHNNWDVAWQLTWIDIEAFSLIAGVLWTTQVFVGRARPVFRDCPEVAPVKGDCDAIDTRGFIAGHAAVATAAAGLTCLHHSHLPLYGGARADDNACLGMIGVAAAVSATRLLAEKHYPTDLVMGIGLGVVAGYLVPQALHYGFGSRPPAGSTMTDDRAKPDRSQGVPALTITVAPMLGSGVMGGTVLGGF